MYVLYLDVLLVINLVMDIIIFAIVSIIMNTKVKKFSLIVSGAIAAFTYCMFIVTPILKDIPSIMYAIIVPVLPILYLFRPNKLNIFIRYYIVSMMVAMLLGGMAFSLWSLLGNDIGDISGISIWMLVSIIIFLGGSFYLLFYNIRRRFILPSFEYQTKFIRNGKELVLKSILDTGNLLYTPINHKPVIVVYYDDIVELMTDSEEKVCKEYCNNMQRLLEHRDKHLIRYIIPFNSVGSSNGLIPGIEVDRIEINRGRYNECRCDSIFENCVVGITMSPLFRQGSYKALLHPEYILEEVG